MLTQIILNPYAAGGRAGEVWSQMESLLRERLGDLLLAITQHPKEVFGHLEQALTDGAARVVSIGGDGTNHALINALANLHQRYPNHPPLPYGMLPVGTGRDWARSQGIPFDFMQAVDWLTQATPCATDIGLLTLEPDTPQHHEVYFLNIASAGLGGEVDARVNQVRQRRPWTFLRATVHSILSYTPQHMQIMLDDQPWYDDQAYLVVVANGTTFGHGMKIAPLAQTDDGLFDVVVVGARSKLRLLTALGSVYRGTHLDIEGVSYAQAKTVTIQSGQAASGKGTDNAPLALDLDGEYATGQRLRFTVQPGLLHLLK
ncbi:MAG: diacylglycerol kinase family lipid kinase [Anaerolineae bacterium]